MAATVIGLTDAKILGLRAPLSGRIEVADKLVIGLRLRVGTSGAKTFIVRKRIGAKTVNMTIGRYHERRLTLADARKRARALLSDIEGGSDPRHLLRKESASKATVRALWPDYKRERAGKRSICEIERIFDRYILPEIGDRLADSIERDDVTRLVDGVTNGGSRPTPVMGRAVALQLSSFFSWAMGRPGMGRLSVNPCRNASKPAAPKPRDRVLDEDELRALWSALHKEPDPFGAGFRLLLLTLQRREEVFDADRSEFDREAQLWTIPADRAKNGRTHLVPLSPAAIAELDRIGAFDPPGKLFPARRNAENGASGISKAWARVRAEVDRLLAAPAERFTPHDLRRTGATGMQRLGIPLPVTESTLNHVSGSRSGIVGVYQTHDYKDEKRQALDKWAADVERIVKGGLVDNVVAIR